MKSPFSGNKHGGGIRKKEKMLAGVEVVEKYHEMYLTKTPS